MAILDIEILGSGILREKAAPVESVTDDLRRLVRDMTDTMYDAEGIGLAAPQVGVSQRILVVDVADEEETRHMHALVNPVIVEFGKKTEKASEGCLSIPGIEESVTRPATVVVEALTPNGDPVRIEADGLLARALQHEVDHLDGILFIDRLSPLKRSILLRKWRKSRSGNAR
ncbi:MAG: peptide deformylase [Gemmatimonadetes bacterium]|nr:peptide deformylase [Gemmatimonadota bacterium]